jgi:hypothetical protein
MGKNFPLKEKELLPVISGINFSELCGKSSIKKK